MSRHGRAMGEAVAPPGHDTPASRAPRRPRLSGRTGASGFTLIEMLVVLAIVGLLAAAAVPLHELTLRRTQELALRQALRTLRDALDAYKEAADQGRIVRPERASGWPPNLRSLVDGVPLADREGTPRDDAPRLFFLRRLPRDPFADPSLPAERTWALRSSDSPPDAPRAGDDVFDVRSSSDAVALDGTRVDSW